MIRSAESVRSKIPHVAGTEFSWKIRSMLERAKPMRSNMTRMKPRALKSTILNKDLSRKIADLLKNLPTKTCRRSQREAHVLRFQDNHSQVLASA
jgi:hypothetical protein